MHLSRRKQRRVISSPRLLWRWGRMGFAHPPPLSWSLLADSRHGRSPVSNEALAYSAGTSQTADSRWRRYRTAVIFVFTNRPAKVERDLLPERLVHSRSRNRRLRSSKIPVLSRHANKIWALSNQSPVIPSPVNRAMLLELRAGYGRC